MPDFATDERDAVLEIERRLRRHDDIDAVLGPTSCKGLHQDLLRFLRAKNGNVDNGFLKAFSYYRWTLAEKPELIGEADIGDELDSGKLLYMCKDKQGRPVFLVRAALHFPPSHDQGFERQSTQKLLVAAIRYAISRMDPDTSQFCLVADMNGFGLCNKDTGILKCLGGLFSKYFPGRLHRLYIINSPFLLWGLWRLIKPLVATKWLHMLVFLSYPKELCEFIETKNLPAIYGGKIIPDWESWTKENTRAILKSRELLLHTFCRSFNGENIPEEELNALHEAALTKSPFYPPAETSPSDEEK